MKKILLFVVCFIVISMVVTFALAGCKKETTEATAAETIAAETTVAETTSVEKTTAAVTLSTEPVTLNIIVMMMSGEINKILDQTIAEFMKLYPNVTVKVQAYGGEDLDTKVRNAIASGGPVDGFMTDAFSAAWYLENNVVAELDPSVFGMTIDEYVAQWLPNTFQSCSLLRNGKYYGIPYNVGNFVGWLNMKNFAKAGLDPAKDMPTTWDKAREIAKKMTIVENGITKQDGVYIYPGLSQDHFILGSMFQQKGLDWLSLDGMIEGCDNPAAVEVLKDYTGFATEDKSFDLKTFDPNYSALFNGVASMTFWGGSWFYGMIETGGGNPDDWQAIKYPRFTDGKDLGGECDGTPWFVTNMSKNKEWTWKLFDYMTSKPEVYIPVGLWLPRVNFDANAAFGNTIKNWDIFVEEYPKSTGSIVDSRVKEIQDANLKAETSVISEGVSAEQAIKNLKVALEAIKQGK